MDDIVKKAAEKYRKMLDVHKPVSAAVILADAYLADLTKREREAAERALPVTADWFYGLDRSHGYLVIEWSEFCGLYARYGDDKVFLNMNPTRGNVLDLLSALGAAKGRCVMSDRLDFETRIKDLRCGREHGTCRCQYCWAADEIERLWELRDKLDRRCSELCDHCKELEAALGAAKGGG